MENPKLPKVTGVDMEYFLMRRTDVIARRTLGQLAPGRYFIFDAAIPVIVEAVDVNKLGPTAVSTIDPSKLYKYNITTDTLTEVTAGTGTVDGTGTANVITSWLDADTIKDGTWAFSTNTIYPLTDGANIGITVTKRVGSIFFGPTAKLDYSDSLIFSEAGVERARFLAGAGHFGINTPTPGASIHVVGEDSTSANFAAQFDDSTGNLLAILDNAGNLGVGVSPTARVHIHGADATDGNFALKCENSSANPLLQIANSGIIGIGVAANPSFKVYITASGYSAGLFLVSDTHGLYGRTTGSGYAGVKGNSAVTASPAILAEHDSDGVGCWGIAYTTGLGVKGTSYFGMGIMGEQIGLLTGNEDTHVGYFYRNQTIGAFDNIGAIVYIEENSGSSGPYLQTENSANAIMHTLFNNGDLNIAGVYKTGGTAGVSGSITALTTATVTNGIITAIV